MPPVTRDRHAGETDEPISPISREQALESAIRAYIALVFVAGAGLTGLILFRWSRPDLVALAVFCVAAGGSELLRVRVRYESVSLSLSVVVMMAAVVALGPAGSVLTAICAALVAGFALRPVPPVRKTIFNLGMFALGGGASGLAYQALGGQVGHGHLFALGDIVPCLAAVVANFAINWPLVIAVVHLTSGKSIRQIWSEALRWTPVPIMVAALIGFTLGAAFLIFGYVGAVVYVAPLVALRETMRMYTSRAAKQIAELQAAHQETDEANQRLMAANEDLDQVNDGLLKTLASVIDARDVYLYGHSVQASKYAGEVARKLGLQPETVREAELGALLHDIGKIGISEKILNKPARLTDEEYNEIKTHCDIGYELLSNLPHFETVADIVRSHHEHYDGSGYPRGLKGKQIHIGARIVSVVEAVEAMVSDRPYRKGMTPDEVLEELANGAGSQWDPDVVEVFSGVLSKDRKHLVMRNSALEVALSRTPLSELVTPAVPVASAEPTLRGMTATFATAAQPIFILDDEYRIVSVNATAERAIGYSEADLEGKDWSDLCAAQELRRGIPQMFFGSTRMVTIAKSDGSTLELEVTGTPLRTNSASYWLVLAHDVSQRVRIESELKQRVRTDYMTQLANREEFETQSLDAMQRGVQPLTLVLVDMDGLKAINDTFGHQCGDEALKALSRAMSSQLRQGDLAARLGGDEFAILMPGSSSENADKLLDRIDAVLPEHYVDLDAHVAFSSGIAQWDGKESLAQLLSRADGLLYERKREKSGQARSVIPLRAVTPGG
jgi:diguanylate cyclase (GGDEF)-like protein/PAS domain S-box-containing protein/putative nucleotidyltransferase with HDIG domain